MIFCEAANYIAIQYYPLPVQLLLGQMNTAKDDNEKDILLWKANTVLCQPLSSYAMHFTLYMVPFILYALLFLYAVVLFLHVVLLSLYAVLLSLYAETVSYNANDSA